MGGIVDQIVIKLASEAVKKIPDVVIAIHGQVEKHNSDKQDRQKYQRQIELYEESLKTIEQKGRGKGACLVVLNIANNGKTTQHYFDVHTEYFAGEVVTCNLEFYKSKDYRWFCNYYVEPGTLLFDYLDTKHSSGNHYEGSKDEASKATLVNRAANAIAESIL